MPKWQTQHLIRCQATLEPSGAAIGDAGSTASRVVVPTKGANFVGGCGGKES
jgi:hypothetical protein